ncbi:TetR/AcrR family transcriptional regulator [candidate division KSB1 bacterium]|nr:TetR/AcrR family transcriptional regulator [candidate division KSB1 bacterium]
MDNNDKRERILKAAAQVFARKGFYNSRIAEIANKANVAEGTIYLYFTNKDELLTTIFEQEMAVVIAEMKEELNKVDDPKDKIKKFIERHLALIDEKREIAEVFQIELRQSHKFMKEYKGTKFRDYLNIISSIISIGQKRGMFRADIIPGIAKRILFGALDEISNYWVLSTTRQFSLSVTAEEIAKIFIRGISLDPNSI